MRDIFIYTTLEAWVSEKPDAVIKGNVYQKHEKYIELSDEQGFVQIINIDKVFAVVY